MKYLIVHQNFPAQFVHVAPALVSRGHQVIALCMRAELDAVWSGVRILKYRPHRKPPADPHPWLADLETKAIRAEAVYRKALQLRQHGFEPDVIVAHHGWGEGTFLKQVWPNARFVAYLEYYYRASGGDIGFDPEFSAGAADDEACRVQMRNLNNALHFDIMDAAVAPTRWQAETFPAHVHDRIAVIHEGIDTASIVPFPEVEVTLNASLRFTRRDEVITFVSRNLEPYRGFHTFMRALPDLLASRPNANVILIGGNDVSYGKRPPNGRSWREVMMREVGPRISVADRKRVHFVGRVPHEEFVALLQLSSVHVYLTYPFVLSWSMLEAMSAGCVILGSRTPPVEEVITHGVDGWLVDFFDARGLAKAVGALLDDAPLRERLGRAAREKVVAKYDLRTRCLPSMVEFLESGRTAAEVGQGAASKPMAEREATAKAEEHDN